MVVPVQLDLLRRIRKPPKNIYPLFIRGRNQNVFSIPLEPSKNIWVQIAAREAVKIDLKNSGCSLRLGDFRKLFTNSILFAIVALVRERGARCVIKDDGHTTM